MRRVSLNMRRGLSDQESAEVQVALIHIAHPDLDTPIRLSTDDTVRLSTEPLAYGTRSTWQTEDPMVDPFLFVGLDILLPDDNEDAPPSARLAIATFESDLARQLLSATMPAVVDLAVVLASSPDLLEYEFRGLELVDVEGDAGEVVLTLSRDPFTSEPSPHRRMTRATYPGLHR